MGERIPCPYVFVDGSGVGDVDPEVMREREELAQDGIVVVNLHLNRSNGLLQKDPEVTTRGFLLARGAEDLMVDLRSTIADKLHLIGKETNVQRDLERAVSSFLYSETRRRPMVIVNVDRG